MQEAIHAWKLIEEGFKLPVSQAADQPGYPINHTQRFVLVDRAGTIRGFYDVLDDPAARPALLADVKRLLSEPPPE